jgi:hypothetical protein
MIYDLIVTYMTNLLNFRISLGKACLKVAFPMGEIYELTCQQAFKLFCNEKSS